MTSKPSSLIPFARQLQTRLINLFVDDLVRARNIRTTLAVDAAYDREYAYTCAILFDVKLKKVVKKWRLKADVFFPYVPGYLFMREAPPIIKLLSNIDMEYDLLLIDAHGRLHPRRAGLATIVGILAEKPTIGVAKSLLVGSVKEDGKVAPIMLGDELLGYKIKYDGSPFYVSQGNMISLKESLEFIKSRSYVYPEELRLADLETKKFRGGP